MSVPIDETIKRVAGEVVTGTLDRTDLWRAQTPQAFRTDVLRDAHAKATADEVESTDDCQLLENMGRQVAVVMGSRTNIKLTYAEDFVLGEALIEARS